MSRWMQWETISAEDLVAISKSRRVVASSYDDPNWTTFSKPVPSSGKVSFALDGSDPDEQRTTVTMVKLYGWRMPEMTPGHTLLRLDDLDQVTPVQFRGGECVFSLIELRCPLFPGPSNSSGAILSPIGPWWLSQEIAWGHAQRREHYVFCPQ